MNNNITMNSSVNLLSKQLTSTHLDNNSSNQILIGTGSDFGVDLYSQINAYRTQFKKKALIQDILGEIALSELMQFNVMNSQDPRFNQIMEKYSLMNGGADQIDYMIYEHHQLPKTGYMQSFTQNDVKEAFQKALDDMVNGAFRLKMLQTYQHSHIAFSCLQTGSKMNVFRIAALITRKSLSVETIVQCCTGMRSTNGFVIVGKVLNNSVKPCLLIVNRGQNNQVTVGPNRMGYSLEDGEFRVMIPDEYQGQFTTQVLQQNSIFEIFVTSADDQSFLYGQGSDLSQNFANIPNELGTSDLIPDSGSSYYAQRVFQRNDSLLTVFNSRDLCGIKGSYQGPLQTINNFQNVPFRTTKTQAMREQQSNNAAFKSQNALGMNINFNKSQTQNLVKIGGGVNFSAQNENQNPNVAQSNKPLTFINQPTGVQLNLKPPSTNFQTSMPFKFNLNSQQQNHQNTQLIPPQASSTLQRAFTIQAPKPTIQTPIPTLNFNFANQQQQQQPLARSQTTSTLTFPQPPKISFNQPVSVAAPTMTPTLGDQRPVVFNDLSLIDQQTLQGYLRELQEELTSEQLQRVTTLMLTDPVKFHQYFQIAHEQLMLQKKETKEKKEETKKSEEKKQEEKKTISEYDDLTVFFLTLPQSLVESVQEKFQDLLKQLTQNKLLPKQVLSKLVIRSVFPTNDSFAQMYSSVRDTGDMILELRTEEFACHKIVMTATSEYFKKALRENEMVNKYQYQVRGPYKQRLIVPEWIDSKALKLYIQYMYTGKIGQIEVVDTLNLLKTANYFYHQCLQEQLIAEYIIPHLNPQSAVLFLKECYQELEDPPHATSHSPNAPVHRKSCTFAWQFLYSYSQYYLSRHLSTLLRSSPKLAYDLNSSLLRRIIDKSLLYVVDSQGRDLDSILQFTAESWTADRSITTLFKKSQQTMDSCSAFHQQIISQMAEFIGQIDPKIDYQCKLIKDSSEDKAVIKTSNSPEQSTAEGMVSMTDNTFFQANDNVAGNKAGSILDNGDEIDINQWKPSSNIIKDVPNTSEIFDKEPQYQTTIQLDDVALRNSFEKNKGLTIFSKAFDFGRRSWMLKIDIDYENNISLYLVERGAPLGFTQNNDEYSAQVQLGVTVPIKFSSVLSQFEIIDPAFGDHKTFVFFSFSHDQNQVIGHENLMNLSQMQNKTQLKVKLHMKEFLMHSALVWHLSQNFQDYFNKDLKQLEIYKNNNCAPYTTSYNNTTTSRDFELLNLRFYTLYQLFSSVHLKLDSENTLLSFLFHYTSYQYLRQPNKSTFAYLVDLLSTPHPLKFYYLSTSKILSALRDNQHMRHSKIFMARVHSEFQARVLLPQSMLLNLSNDQALSKDQQPRKYYDTSRIEGRKKYEGNSNNNAAGIKAKVGSVFIEELLEWLRKSKHQKKMVTGNGGSLASQQYKDDGYGSQYARQEILKLQALYYEERRKCQDLQAQMARVERRNQELEKLIGHGDQWKYGILRKSNSQNEIRHQRYYSPPNARLNMNNEILNAARQARNAAVPVSQGNNSFDQSAFFSLKNSQELFNDTFKNPLGGSTVKAERKVITNQYADMSRLLNRIDRNNSPNNNRGRQQQPPYYQSTNNNNAGNGVPYYRQSKQNNDECTIF